MKSYLILLLGALYITGCSEPAETTVPGEPEIMPEDCNREAGFFWSEVKKDCVQLFRDALKMKPDHPDARQHGKVFVVFSQDSSRAEVWIPFDRFTYIYERQGPRGTRRWTKDDLAVDCQGEDCLFMEKETILYREQKK